jgi:hypothetical protein
MKAEELAVSRWDSWRNIALTLIDLIASIGVGIPTGIVSVIACLRQRSIIPFPLPIEQLTNVAELWPTRHSHGNADDKVSSCHNTVDHGCRPVGVPFAAVVRQWGNSESPTFNGSQTLANPRATCSGLILGESHPSMFLLSWAQ